MRIGNVLPRINGIVHVPSLRGLGDYNTIDQATSDINRTYTSFINELPYNVAMGNAASPDTVAQAMRGYARDVCNNSVVVGSGCDASTFEPLIQKLTQQYAAALADQQQKVAAAIASGQYAGTQRPTVVSGGTVNTPPAIPSYQSTPSASDVAASVLARTSSGGTNALDRVTPVSTPVVTSPSQNALTPPGPQRQITNVNAGTFTGTQTTTLNPGATEENIGLPPWAYLIAAGIGLYLLVGRN